MGLRLGEEPILCPPIVDFNDNVKETIVKYKDYLKLVEIRYDYLYGKVSLNDILEYVRGVGLHYIFTFRRFEEGGNVMVDDSVRAETMARSLDYSPSLIDIELNSLKANPLIFKPIIEDAKSRGIGIIISYHNFKATESLEALKRIAHEEYSLEADVLKISTMVNSVDDVLTLLTLTKELRDTYDLPLVVLGMGELGKITRIASPFFGSDIVYVDLFGSSAPGQLKFDDALKIFEVLY